MDLNSLRWHDLDTLDVWRHNRAVGYAVGELCDALDDPPAEGVTVLAHRARRVVAELRDELDAVYSDDYRTREKLELTRQAIEDLLDAIEPLVR